MNGAGWLTSRLTAEGHGSCSDEQPSTRRSHRGDHDADANSLTCFTTFHCDKALAQPPVDAPMILKKWQAVQSGSAELSTDSPQQYAVHQTYTCGKAYLSASVLLTGSLLWSNHECPQLTCRTKICPWMLAFTDETNWVTNFGNGLFKTQDSLWFCSPYTGNKSSKFSKVCNWVNWYTS